MLLPLLCCHQPELTLTKATFNQHYATLYIFQAKYNWYTGAIICYYCKCYFCVCVFYIYINICMFWQNKCFSLCKYKLNYSRLKQIGFSLFSGRAHRGDACEMCLMKAVHDITGSQWRPLGKQCCLKLVWNVAFESNVMA